MENKEFCVFIITHGRPDNVITLKTLKKAGYTGRIYFIVDNEDKTIDKYIKNFCIENIKIFDKKFYADQTDEGNNFDNRKTTTHARNACFDIAENLGITYFLELDDDYTSFEWRYENKKCDKLLVYKITNLDYVINRYLIYYIENNFMAIAFAQGGDFIGGVNNPYVKNKPLLRKCMNSFFCSIERKFKFMGQLNEDVNTYVVLGSRGDLFGTIQMINIVQKATQKTEGGMTDAYLQYGTYCKAFTTVMMHPSSVSVIMMQKRNKRLHHSIRWANTVPCIIDEKYKK